MYDRVRVKIALLYFGMGSRVRSTEACTAKIRVKVRKLSVLTRLRLLSRQERGSREAHTEPEKLGLR